IIKYGTWIVIEQSITGKHADVEIETVLLVIIIHRWRQFSHWFRPKFMQVVCPRPEAVDAVYGKPDFRCDPRAEDGLRISARFCILPVVGKAVEIQIPLQLLCAGSRTQHDEE